MEALDQTISQAKGNLASLVHHSDHGSQYVSSAYGSLLADHGTASSTGTVGDSYDNALAETVNGLYKTELIYSQTWAGVTQVEFATMNWVHWWNTTRLHEALGHRTPTRSSRLITRPIPENRHPFKKRNKTQDTSVVDP